MEYLKQALEISTSNGMRYGEGMTLASLGDGRLALGQPDQARDAWQRAHPLLASLGAPEAPWVLAKPPPSTGRARRRRHVHRRRPTAVRPRDRGPGRSAGLSARYRPGRSGLAW